MRRASIHGGLDRGNSNEKLMSDFAEMLQNQEQRIAKNT